MNLPASPASSEPSPSLVGGEEGTIRFASRLTQKFALKAVMHLPELSQEPTLAPTLAQTLRSLDETAGVRWAVLPGAVGVSPSAYLGRSPVVKVPTGPFAYEDRVQRLIASFSAQQLEEFRAGRAVLASDLSRSQLQIVQSLAPDQTDQQEQKLFDTFLEQGIVECLIEDADTGLFSEGLFLEGEDFNNGTFNQQVQEYRQEMQGQSLESLFQEALQRLPAQTKIQVLAPRKMTLDEAVTLAFGETKTQVTVSRLLRNEKIVVSAGEYSNAELLALALFAGRATMRKVGTLIYIAPDEAIRGQRKFQEEQLVEAERIWRGLEAAVAAAAQNPRSRFAPFKADAIMQPNLLPFDRLSAEQQRFVLKEERIAQEKLQDLPPNLECYAGPTISINFRYRDGLKLLWGDGTGLTVNYQWLKWRQSQNSANNAERKN